MKDNGVQNNPITHWISLHKKKKNNLCSTEKLNAIYKKNIFYLLTSLFFWPLLAKTNQVKHLVGFHVWLWWETKHK